MPTSTIDNGEIKNVHVNASAGFERSKLALETKKFNIDLEQLRIHDSASNAVLPNSASGDDLALILGSRGTTGFRVETGDAKATTVTQYAAGRFWLPAEYEAGGTIAIAAYAGMHTTVSDGTATIDFEVYKKNEADYTHGSDLCTTGATTINSLTLGEKAFTITPTGCNNGDEFNFRLTIAITDSATGTAVHGVFSKLYLNLQVRG